MKLEGITEAINGYRADLDKFQAVVEGDDILHQAAVLQQSFSQILWPQLTQLDLNQYQSRWDAVTTELHRDMRLLMVEVNFARAAGPSRQKRLEQIRQRIAKLQTFTQGLLSLLTSATEE